MTRIKSTTILFSLVLLLTLGLSACSKNRYSREGCSSCADKSACMNKKKQCSGRSAKNNEAYPVCGNCGAKHCPSKACGKW